MPLNKYGSERGVTRKYLMERHFMVNKGAGNVYKKGRLDKKGVKKKWKGCNPQRNYFQSYSNLQKWINLIK